MILKEEWPLLRGSFLHGNIGKDSVRNSDLRRQVVPGIHLHRYMNGKLLLFKKEPPKCLQTMKEHWSLSSGLPVNLSGFCSNTYTISIFHLILPCAPPPPPPTCKHCIKKGNWWRWGATDNTTFIFLFCLTFGDTEKESGSERGEGRGERWGGGGGGENSHTLFYKDCSLGSVKNLTTSPCYATDE